MLQSGVDTELRMCALSYTSISFSHENDEWPTICKKGCPIVQRNELIPMTAYLLFDSLSDDYLSRFWTHHLGYSIVREGLRASVCARVCMCV
jgi:hypothetical protein